MSLKLFDLWSFSSTRKEGWRENNWVQKLFNFIQSKGYLFWVYPLLPETLHLSLMIRNHHPYYCIYKTLFSYLFCNFYSFGRIVAEGKDFLNNRRYRALFLLLKNELWYFPPPLPQRGKNDWLKSENLRHHYEFKVNVVPIYLMTINKVWKSFFSSKRKKEPLYTKWTYYYKP